MKNKAVYTVAKALLLSSFVFLQPLQLWAAQAKPDQTVAVFPFKVLNKDPRAMHLGEGASEHIITHLVQSKTIEVVEDEGSLVVLDMGVSVNEIARALNAIGATPRDLIAIFQAIKAAGALQGELIIL